MDDGDDDLPAQPRARQAPRRADGAARDPARRADRRVHEAALPAQRAGRPDDRDPRRDDRGRHPPDRDRGVDRLPGRRGLRDPARHARGVRGPARQQVHRDRRRRRDGAPAGRRPAAVQRPAARRRRALPRLRGGHREADDPGLDGGLDRARRGRRPRGPAAALGGQRGRRQVGGRRGARGPHRRLQLRLRHGRAAVPAAQRRRAARRQAAALAALPDRRQDPHRRDHDLHAPARDLLDHRGAGRRAARGVALVARRERGARR